MTYHLMFLVWCIAGGSGPFQWSILYMQYSAALCHQLFNDSTVAH